MIHEVDVNKDGSINFQEFVKMMDVFDEKKEIVEPKPNKFDQEMEIEQQIPQYPLNNQNIRF